MDYKLSSVFKLLSILYLQGIAGMKLYDEESVLLLQLITCRPPPTEAGLRFVALGLCMLMACPSLIALPEQEQRGFQWVNLYWIPQIQIFITLE